MKPKRNKESSADSRTPATKFPHPPFPNFCYFFEFVKTSIRGDGHSLVEISTDTAAYISSRIMGPAGRSVLHRAHINFYFELEDLACGAVAGIEIFPFVFLL